ncbi:lyase family protein [Nocardioides sambongensis]|uniref:lyase family protein n=1 Tax=Nocardioides sambongensis TaxID=2589074 RepID=UPI00112D8253|nr:lyase family protein [Nocardioides sambongensis]
MTSLWWPGDHRAGDLLSDRALLHAMAAAEAAWSAALADAGIAPAEAAVETSVAIGLADRLDIDALARDAESGGNPVIGLVAALRRELPEPAGSWLHRGLTSQDVFDTAAQLCLRDAVAAVRADLTVQVERLTALAEEHRHTPSLARTLTQPAMPTTFGLKAADWLAGLLDAGARVTELDFPVQLGGAAGTLAALVELAGPDRAGLDRARMARASWSRLLGLAASGPWHTRRGPVTRSGDALVGLAGAWGRIANDVLVLGRPEIGELADGSAGGSSTMPHKANPTLAVLVRRHALAAPGHGATLHAAAAAQVDERADGGWHAEWSALSTLGRHSVVAAGQATDLLAGLRVHTDRMAAALDAYGEALLSEQRTMAGLAGRPAAPGYRGLTDDLIDETLSRARTWLAQEEHP